MAIAETGKNNPHWNGGKVKKICQVCNKEIYISSYKNKRGYGRFCSKKCRGIYQRGKNSSTWKGGITPIRERIRTSLQYQQWRQSIFIRDNFTCQKCGDNQGGNLQAHHKESFSKLIQKAKEYLPLLGWYDACLLYSPLWNINNGIILCESCHKETKNYKKKARKEL